MAVNITYFVHGTTTDNEKKLASGWYDVNLSELGIQQANELRDKINLHSFDVVFCSDLKRAIKSAEIIFKETTPIIIDPRLRECNYGIHNAAPSKIVEELQEKHIETKFPEGESCKDVQNRISDFLKDLKTKYDGKKIAIVAHKFPQLSLDVIIKGYKWEEAFENDWRKTKSWQPGWNYTLQ